MFIGYYELEGKVYNNIYYSNFNGFREWHKDTFSPTCENIETLFFKIRGKTYQEKKESLEELAKEWQHRFSNLSWSWSEIAEITNYFYENARRYGLAKEFKENGIC